ncbi:MAG: rRNA maturation RNase YbeY [Elusimicrobiota bacterium]
MIIRVFGISRLPASARQPKILVLACRKALRLRGADGSGEISIVFLDRARMRRLNKKFLNHGRDTDVIAFPYARSPISAGPFGDIFVSAFMARRQARMMGHSIIKESATLVAHGALHLLGLSDKRQKQKSEMFRLQDQILSSLPI